jgi:hypothetical protein
MNQRSTGFFGATPGLIRVRQDHAFEIAAENADFAVLERMSAASLL